MKTENLTEQLADGLTIGEKIKMGLLLQAISKEPINILIVGDPGSGKSRLLKSVNKLVPNSNYASGNIYSRLSPMKEIAVQQFTKKSDLLLLDNLTYVSEEDMPIIHEIIDFGIKVTAACNPKFGRFDPYGLIAEQIGLSPMLINRFDLLFTLRDYPDPKSDRAAARHLLNGESFKPKLTNDQFTEFIESCKRFNPVLTEEAKKLIEDYFVKLRNRIKESVPISLKQVEGIAKLAKAHAMLNHSNKASSKDAKAAIDLMEYCIMDLCFESETGHLDIDRIETYIPAATRLRISKILKIIDSLGDKIGKIIPIDDICEEAKKEGIDEEKFAEVLDKLKRSGTIFEAREGFIQKI